MKLGFKATPHIKNRPHLPDRIPYHPYAEYPVVWICEVDSSANCPLFQRRGERKIACQRVVQDGYQAKDFFWHAQADFTSGITCQGVIGGAHARSIGPVCVHGSSSRITCTQRLGN